MIPKHIAPEGVPFGRARELERLAQRSEADLRLRLRWKEKDAAPRSGCALVELTSERVETRCQRVRTQHKKLPAAHDGNSDVHDPPSKPSSSMSEGVASWLSS